MVDDNYLYELHITPELSFLLRNYPRVLAIRLVSKCRLNPVESQRNGNNKTTDEEDGDAAKVAQLQMILLLWMNGWWMVVVATAAWLPGCLAD